jgi:hypothetical protein
VKKYFVLLLGGLYHLGNEAVEIVSGGDDCPPTTRIRGSE